MSKKSPLLYHLEQLEFQSSQKEITIGELIKIFGFDGHLILMIFLSIPFLQPIPVPGLSTPFGVLMILISFYASKGKPPWIPRRWQKIILPRETIHLISSATKKTILKLEYLIHPRLKILTSHKLRWLQFLVISINAFLLSLPFPIPFTNTVPAFAVLFISLGLLEKDGILIILSYIQSIICLIYFGFLFKGAEQLSLFLTQFF